jgi:hypothetical protein
MKYKINNNYKIFIDFVKNIQNDFFNSSSTIHKARNELKIIKANDIECVVKSFKVPNFIRRIVYTFFRDSKAKKSYDNSIKIGNFTPDPIGYIEFYDKNLLNDSYFIAKKFDYDFTIREPLLDTKFKNRDEIFRAFAKFTLELHNNDIFHNDYSPGNILIKKIIDGYEFKIVDINRMKFFKLNQMQRAKNFSKLWASDEILHIIANEYQKHYRCNDHFTKEILYYSNKNKQIKNFKKRLKGQEVND